VTVVLVVFIVGAAAFLTWGFADLFDELRAVVDEPEVYDWEREEDWAA
jgi:hypothetical protein